jgi:hypothetical protein
MQRFRPSCSSSIRAVDRRLASPLHLFGAEEPIFMHSRQKRVSGIAFAIGVLAGLVLSLSCASKEANQPPQMGQLTSAISAPDRPDPPQPLSPQAKALLHDRMASHAEDMSDLVSAIMLLEYSRIITRADKIASDVNLSRPISQDATELNSGIPERFFVRQDDLKAAARALGEAARSANPYRVADAYGRVSEACVRCHADFRPGV